MPALSPQLRRHWPVLFLAVLPLLVHLPALSGAYRFDPLYLVSGTTPGTWRTNGAFIGYPGWIDGNAGVTTEALGRLAAQDWLAGRVPWWNPFTGIGLPLAAEGQTTALFLPFGLLLALPHGLLMLRMLLMALAGVSSWALLRRLRLDPLPSLTGAALFELNGSFAWLAHGPMMPVAFLPLMLLGAEQARQRFPLALAAGVAWSFLAGFPETAALNLLLAASWCALRLAQAADRRAYAGRALAAACAGLAAAAPAIWPFLQALPQEFLSSHGSTLSTGFTPANWALLLFPYLFGAAAQSILHGRLYALWAYAGGYADLVLVALAGAALRRRGREAALRWLLAAYLAVTLLRAGGVAPVTTAFALVPLLRQAMVQIYAAPGWAMALSVLGALTLQDLRDGLGLPWRRTGAALALAALAALFAARADLAQIRAFVPPAASICAVALPVLALAAAASLALRARPAAAAAVILAQAAALYMLPLFAGTHGRRLDDGAIGFLQAHLGTARVVSFGPLVPNYGAYFGIAEIDHNYLPVPQSWVDAVRRDLMPDCDGVNFYPDAARDGARLSQYAKYGVRYALVWPGTPLPGTRLAYRGQVMDIRELPDPAPYASAPGCAIAGGRDAFTAHCEAPALLTRRELGFPGWHASINGAPATLGTAGVFQTLPLPAGDSRIVFAYAPPGSRAAWLAAAAGISLMALAALSQIARPRHRARAAAPRSPAG